MRRVKNCSSVRKFFLWIKKSFMLFINRKSSSLSHLLMLYIHGSIIEKGLDKHFHSTAAAADIEYCMELSRNLRIYNEGKMNSMKNPEKLFHFSFYSNCYSAKIIVNPRSDEDKSAQWECERHERC